MKLLVIGCNGMAGQVISLYFREQGHEVTGYAREKSEFVDTVVADAADFAVLGETVLHHGYDAVINCAGLLQQPSENSHAQAVLINGYLPHYLAEITENTGIRIIHMSTDCVFSGKTGGYTEDSVPDGTLFYDRSKAVGELDDHKNVTLRNSIVGPDTRKSGTGLLNWFLQQDGTVDGYTGAVWTGQTTLQLAKTMEQTILRGAHGLYHAVPRESISKYELLTLFNRYIRRHPVDIIPTGRFVSDKSLIRTRYEGLEYEIPGYADMVKELGDWMREHKELYPHYDL